MARTKVRKNPLETNKTIVTTEYTTPTLFKVTNQKGTTFNAALGVRCGLKRQSERDHKSFYYFSRSSLKTPSSDLMAELSEECKSQARKESEYLKQQRQKKKVMNAVLINKKKQLMELSR